VSALHYFQGLEGLSISSVTFFAWNIIILGACLKP